jgi:hypothetical protein
MQVIIDLSQSPKQLEDDLNRVVRLALGNTYFIDSDDPQVIAQQGNGLPANVGAEVQPNFSPNELANPLVNLPGGAAPNALPGANAGSTPAGAALDSAGNPWDARIHSGGKSTLQDGTWKLKKGVDKALVDQITAQNKALIASPLPGNQPPVTAAQPLNNLPPLNATGLPDLPPLNPEPVQQLPAADVEVTDYPSFAQWIAQQSAKPGLADAVKANLDHGLKHYGFVDAQGNPHLPAVAHRPDAIDGFYRWLKFQLLGQN